MPDEEGPICPECGQDFAGGRPTPKAALGLHRFRAHNVRSTAPSSHKKGGARRKAPARPKPVPVAEPVEVPPPVLFDSEEVAPKRRRFYEGWFTDRSPRPPGEIRPAKPGRPRKSHRTSFAGGGSLAWMGMSQLAMSTGNIPVGRALQIQAMVAGDVLDNAVAGTKLDKIVQPFIGETDKLRDVGMLVAFPLLVGICQRQPANTATAGLLEMVVRQNLHALAEGVKRMRAEDRKLADTVETLTGVGMDLGDNPVHTILSMIFAPVEAVQAPMTAPVPGPAPEPPAPAPAPGQAPFAEGNGHGPAVEPLPFGSVIVTPADVPPGL